MTSIGKFARILSGSACVMALAAPAFAQEAGADGEIVVTASRVARSGFTAPTPTTVLGEAAVQARGATNVAEVINEIPAFRASNTPAAAARGGGASGQSFLDIRGLNGQGGTATARTLVLLDGRRVVPANPYGLVDINMIPSALIGRTEVVTGGASAAYGSDAISGVVNLMLKDRIDGIEGSISYGQSAENDYQEYSVNLAGGAEFANGRAHLIAGAEYTDNQGIPDGYISRDWNRQAYGDVSFTAPTPARPAGTPYHNILPNVVFSDTIAPGGVIVSTNPALDNLAFVSGATPTGGTTYKFVNGALTGTNQMTGVPGSPYLTNNTGVFFIGGSNLVNPIKRGSFFSRLTFDFTPNVTGFLEASHSESEFNGFSASARNSGPTAFTIRNDNFFLPASVKAAMATAGVTTITVGRVAYDTDFGFYKTHTDTALSRVATGLRGNIFDDWKWDAYYQYGENNYVQHNESAIVSNYAAAVDTVDGVTCRSTTAYQGSATFGPALLGPADSGCVPFNIFGIDAPQANRAGAINYIKGVGVNDVTTRENVAAINLRGDIFELPAGPVSFATGLEYRKEEAHSTVDPNSAARRYELNNFQPINGEYDTKEVYAETVVPLIKDQTLFKLLEFNAAARYTDYSTSGGVTTWKAGLTYEPINDLRFRATQSRDVRAPNLAELFAGEQQLRQTVAGVQRNILQRSNPLLTPEEADTTTYGAIYSPSWFSGFRASVDYYQILINDVISTFSGQEVYDRCAAGFPGFCDLINPGRTPAFTPTSPTAGIIDVATYQTNFSARKTSGVDLEFSYAVPTDFLVPGQFQFRALGTYVHKFVLVEATLGPIDRVKQVVPQWTWNYSVNYNLGRFGANATVRAIGETVVDSTYVDPTYSNYNVNAVFTPVVPGAAAPGISINDNTRGPTAYLNLSASYDLIEQDNKQLQLFGVVNNVLDRDPPNGAGGNPVGASLYDLVGRAYKVGLRFKY